MNKKKTGFIALPILIIFVGFCIYTSCVNGFPINDDITIELYVNDVNVDDALSGSTIPIPPDYTINFLGKISFHKSLTINFIELVILEAGIRIHEPFRIEELSNVHFDAGNEFGIVAEVQIPEEFIAIINQIRGTHQLQITIDYTLDELNQHKDFSVNVNIFITYDNVLEPLATATGATTVIITVLGVTSAVGAISAIGAASPFLSGKYFAQLKQLWKAFKASKEISKLSIGGIPLKAKIFSMDQLQQFLEQFG